MLQFICFLKLPPTGKEALEALEANEAFYMSIYKQIFDDAIEAMRAQEEPRLTVLKGVKAVFVNELLAKKTKVAELSDEDALVIIRRLVNQRKDSIEQFTKGGRKDLVKNETAELKILEEYLPAQMNEAEIKKVAEKKKKELGIAEKAKTGVLMSAVMKELKGKADGATVKKVVEGLLG